MKKLIRFILSAALGVIIGGFIYFGIYCANAQDKPKAKETPIATPTPDGIPDSARIERNPSGSFAVAERLRKEDALKALTLTDAETKEGIKLQGELDGANAAFEAVMEKAQGQTADADLLLSIWKAKTMYANAKAVRARATKWFEDAQKAHDCVGCTLEKGVFIKPEAKK